MSGCWHCHLSQRVHVFVVGLAAVVVWHRSQIIILRLVEIFKGAGVGLDVVVHGEWWGLCCECMLED